MASSQVGVPVEVVLAGTASGTTPGPDIDVEVTGPDGYRVALPAFWGGDGLPRMRFAAPEPGRYRYATSSADPAWSGAEGELEAVPYGGTNLLYRQGRLRVAPSGRTLEHADGTPFLWIGDTWWMGLGTRLPWPAGFRSLTADRVAKGFTVIQMVAGPLPEFHATDDGVWHPQQANEAGWPWRPGWESLDPRFYDLADRRIAHLVDAGLVPCLVGMWGYYLTLMGEERARQHWRNLVARYAAYPVVFCLAGEVKMPIYVARDDSSADASRTLQAEGWSRIGHLVRQLDPYRNPITAHPVLPDARTSLTDESVLDVNMLQTSHWSYTPPSPQDTARISAIVALDYVQQMGLVGAVEMVRNAYAKTPVMPVVNGEPCYEGMHGSNWQDVQRFLFWSGMLSGQAGHTYGAQGIWQMNSLHEPFSHTVANWGYGYWEEAMHYAGGRQVALGGRMLRGLDWWRLVPLDEPDVARRERIGTLGAGIPGELAIYYLPALCVEERLRGVRDTCMSAPSEGSRARFLDPRTGEWLDPFEVRLDDDGAWPCPTPPSREDWLMLVDR